MRKPLTRMASMCMATMMLFTNVPTINALANEPPDDVYNINYELNGGTTVSENVTTYTVSSDSITLINPTKDGYDFEGWTGSNGDVPEIDITIPTGSTGDKDYSANWKAIKYIIDYILNGGSVSGNSTEYTIETETFGLNAPTKEGSIFLGWTGSNGTEPEKNVTITKGSKGDKEYTANWDYITYEVKYNKNDDLATGTMTNSTHVYDTEKKLTANNYNKVGYHFTGWSLSNNTVVVYVDEESVKNLTTTDGDVVDLFANWDANSYEVKYDANSDSVSGNMVNSIHTYDTEKALNTNKYSKVGYDFSGWSVSENGTVTYSDGEYVNNLSSIDGDVVTIYAQWNPINYVVKFDTDGSACVSKIASYDEEFTLPTSTKIGYTFNGWNGNGFTKKTGNVKNLTTTKGEEIVLTADWTPYTYVVKYDTKGGSACDNTNATYDVAFNLPTTERNGYTFKGWTGCGLTDYIGSAINLSTVNESTVTLTADWTPVTYGITYNLNNGTADNITTYTIETPTTNIVAPIRTGYTFVGWTGSNGTTPETSISIENGSTGDKEFTANWKANSYTITLDAVDGVILDNGSISDNSVSSNDITVNYNETYELPDAYKLGYTFNGWNGDGYTNAKGEQPKFDKTSDVYLTADYTPTTYLIKFETGDSSVSVNDITATYDEEIILPTPTRNGYNFLGWKNIDTDTVINLVSDGSEVTLTAIWEKIDTHEDTEIRNRVEATCGSDGYSGDLWCVTGNHLISNGEVIPATGEHSYGKWSTIKEATTEETGVRIHTCTVCGHQETDEIPVLVPDCIHQHTSIVDAKDATCTENGYTGDKVCNDCHEMIEQGQVIGALGHEWGEWVVTQDATETADGHKVRTCGRCGYQEEEVIPKIDGNNNNTNDNNQPVVSEYNITLDGNGLEIKDNVIKTKEGKISIPNFARTGYELVGWTTEKNGSTPNVDDNTVYKADTTIYAIWKVKQTTVPTHITYVFGDGKDKYEVTYKLNKNDTVSISKVDGNVKKLNIPSKVENPDGKEVTVTAIDDNAFANNKVIEQVIIPKTVKTIGKKAFKNCKKLKTAKMSNSVTEIKDSAFEGCNNLKNVTISKNIKKIGKNAFKNCKKCKTIKITSTKITKVGKNAFSGCYKKLKIKVPKKCLKKYKKIFKKAIKKGMTITTK